MTPAAASGRRPDSIPEPRRRFEALLRGLVLPVAGSYPVPAVLLSWLESFQRGLVTPWAFWACIALGALFILQAPWPFRIRLPVATAHMLFAYWVMPYAAYAALCMVTDCLPD